MNKATIIVLIAGFLITTGAACTKTTSTLDTGKEEIIPALIPERIEEVIPEEVKVPQEPERVEKPEVEKPEEVPPEKAAASKEEYTEFALTFSYEEKMDFQAKTKIKQAKEIQEKEKEILDRDRQRVNDIMLISETLQKYYRDKRKYFQSKTMPTGIEPYYLVPTLKDPLTGDPYNWLDNTPGALTGCDDQHFCLWAELEGSSFKFKVASEKGVTQLKTRSTKCPCL